MLRAIVIVVLAGIPPLAADADLSKARALFDRTQYDQALEELARQDQGLAAVQNLTGQAQFMRNEYKKATEAFEKLVAADPNSSAGYHWLGKAYGRRAETANPLSAAGLASKARQNFEKAVAKDPRNLEAMNDLLQYYLEAPGFMGGGLDKASALAGKIEVLDPVEHHFALAEIAQRRKNYGEAEEHLRKAVELAPRQVGRLVDLAKFLARQGKEQESEAAFAEADKIAPGSPKVLFARASTYVKARKNLGTARTLLERYLSSPLTPDDPPREEALKLLKQAGA